ncbi:MAG: prolyl oligopeptidase family serine peptidase [Actinomycetota bacterium]|nr:prolyl oligopeptidase family serine peptidase [Actinomycetota bacterium]
MARLPYPPTPTVDQVDDYHGTRVADPYRWLEDVDAPETRAWVAAQNGLTEAWLSEVAARDAIRDRIAALTDHPRVGPPWQRGGRWFQLRNTGLQDQDVLYTMPAPDADGTVLLDPNGLSDDGTVALTGLAVSDDGRRLAYATSAQGSDWMTWRVRDVPTGRDLPDLVEWSKFSTAAWAPDGSGFWYAAYDAPAPGQAYEQVNRNQRLCFHRLGDTRADPVVYARPDQPEWGFAPQVTEDGRWLVVTVWHGTQPTNRVALQDLTRAGAGIAMLLGEADAEYDFVGTAGDVLLFRTDAAAPFGRVVAVDPAAPQRDAWREVVPEARDTLERTTLVGGRLLGVYLVDAAHRLRWFALDGAPLGELALPGLGSVDAVTGRPQEPECCFTVATFTAPPAVYLHDVERDETRLLHRPALPVDVDLVTEQRFVRSIDGTAVPVFLTRRRDVEPDGDRPVWLYGYGGFRIPVTPGYRSEWLVWLELGGVLAVANLRGGGEYGKAWHDAGRLGAKQQVFDDAIAVAEDLVASGWTRPGRLAVHGRSNGGLLAAACLTQRPDLFGAAVPEVGVLDMLRFHTFTIGWGWASDYGCADDPEQFPWLYAYSPLHNLRDSVAYPATLLTTGDHDDRVVPGHSYKFAAALQAAQGGDAPVLLRVEVDAGHGAGKPTSKLVAERADVVTFLVRTLGVDVVAGYGAGMETPRNQAVCPRCGEVRLETPPGTTILPTLGMARKAAGAAGECDCGRPAHERPPALRHEPGAAGGPGTTEV